MRKLPTDPSGGPDKPISGRDNSVLGMRYTSAAQGAAIPIVHGQTRIPCTMIYANQPGGWLANYLGEYMMLVGFCEGEIDSVGEYWQDAANSAAIPGGWAVHAGSIGQAVDSVILSTFPTDAYPYNAIAYASIKGATRFGAKPTPGNLNFEVIGKLQRLGQLDAFPPYSIEAILSNAGYGAGIPAAYLDPNIFGSAASFEYYCAAAGIFLSPALVTVQAAREHLGPLVQACNSELVWSDGLLKIIPYGDTEISATYGATTYTYTPDTSAVYDLTDDDFITDSPGTDPITIDIVAPSDAYNKVTLEFLDRSNNYAPTPLTVRDSASIEAFGERAMDDIAIHAICESSIASHVAQTILQRVSLIRRTFHFKLGWQHARLEPMDIVSLTDSVLGLSATKVRITEIEEDESNVLSITAEEFIVGSATAIGYTIQIGTQVSPNVTTPSPVAATINNPQTGDGLVYDATSGTFINQAGGSGWSPIISVTLGATFATNQAFKLVGGVALPVYSTDVSLPQVDGVILESGSAPEVVPAAMILNNAYTTPLALPGSDGSDLYLGQDGKLTATIPTIGAGDAWWVPVARRNTSLSLIFDPANPIKLA